MHTDDIYSDFSGFYDIYVGAWMADLPFYLDHARQSGGPILEIGAGTGRLTVPLAVKGFPVVAVDVSKSMLARLQLRLEKESPAVRERVTAVEADVCNLNLGTRYPMIMVPFFTFNYMLTRQAQEAALQAIRRHVTDGGKVLIDIFTQIKEPLTEPVLRVDMVDQTTGCRVQGWVVYSLDKANHLEGRRHIFEVTDPGGRTSRKEFSTLRRYLFKDEIETLFQENGFCVQSVSEDFPGRSQASPRNAPGAGPATSHRLVYVLRKG